MFKEAARDAQGRHWRATVKDSAALKEKDGKKRKGRKKHASSDPWERLRNKLQSEPVAALSEDPAPVRASSQNRPVRDPSV